LPDELRSLIKHHLVLHRINPEQGIWRFYSLMMERDLFGTIRLVRNWGWIRATDCFAAPEPATVVSNPFVSNLPSQ
jgi:hypothetical protein